MNDNIYQRLYDLVLEHDIKVIKKITNYSYGPITSYTFLLADGTEFTTRNINRDINDDEVRYIISSIEKHHERSGIVFIDNLISWLNDRAEFNESTRVSSVQLDLPPDIKEFLRDMGVLKDIEQQYKDGKITPNNIRNIFGLENVK